MFGLFSTFPVDAAKSTELLRGGYPAKYGGRLSSVLNVITDEGNKERFEVRGGADLLNSRLTLQGPAGRGSWLISGRRTHLEPLIAAVRNAFDLQAFGYRFYDLQGKTHQVLSHDDQFTLAGYTGQDNLQYRFDEFDFDLEWGNRTISSRWTHVFDSSLFGNFLVTGSRFKASTLFHFEDVSLRESNRLTDLSFKGDINYFPSQAHKLELGILGKRQSTEYLFGESDQLWYDIDVTGYHHSAYVQDNWTAGERLTLQPGLRFSYFSNGGYSGWSPRLAGRYRLGPETSLKAAVGRYHQYIFRLTREFQGISLLSNIWVLADSTASPGSSTHFVAGLESRRFGIDIDGELYYKDYGGLYEINYDEQESSEIGDILRRGDGVAFGLDLLLRKRSGRHQGWLSLSLGVTERTIDGLNLDGAGREQAFRSKFDRRANLNLAHSLRFRERWSLNTRAAYASGQPYTQVFGRGELTLPTERRWVFEEKGPLNGSRLPSYQRLDVSIARGFEFTSWGMTAIIQVINLTNHRNVFNYYWTQGSAHTRQAGKRREIPMLPLLPQHRHRFRVLMKRRTLPVLIALGWLSAAAGCSNPGGIEDPQQVLYVESFLTPGSASRSCCARPCRRSGSGKAARRSSAEPRSPSAATMSGSFSRKGPTRPAPTPSPPDCCRSSRGRPIAWRCGTRNACCGRKRPSRGKRGCPGSLGDTITYLQGFGDRFGDLNHPGEFSWEPSPTAAGYIIVIETLEVRSLPVTAEPLTADLDSLVALRGRLDGQVDADSLAALDREIRRPRDFLGGNISMVRGDGSGIRWLRDREQEDWDEIDREDWSEGRKLRRKRRELSQNPRLRLLDSRRLDAQRLLVVRGPFRGRIRGLPACRGQELRQLLPDRTERNFRRRQRHRSDLSRRRGHRRVRQLRRRSIPPVRRKRRGRQHESHRIRKLAVIAGDTAMRRFALLAASAWLLVLTAFAAAQQEEQAPVEPGEESSEVAPTPIGMEAFREVLASGNYLGGARGRVPDLHHPHGKALRERGAFRGRAFRPEGWRRPDRRTAAAGGAQGDCRCLPANRAGGQDPCRARPAPPVPRFRGRNGHGAWNPSDQRRGAGRGADPQGRRIGQRRLEPKHPCDQDRDRCRLGCGTGRARSAGRYEGARVDDLPRRSGPVRSDRAVPVQPVHRRRRCRPGPCADGARSPPARRFSGPDSSSSSREIASATSLPSLSAPPPLTIPTTPSSSAIARTARPGTRAGSISREFSRDRKRPTCRCRPETGSSLRRLTGYHERSTVQIVGEVMLPGFHGRR